MSRRGAHQRPTTGGWRRRAVVGLLLVLAASGIVLLLGPLFDGSPSPGTDSASSPSPAASPETVTVTEPMDPEQLRAEFISQAARDRGWDRALGDAAPASLAQQVCSTIKAGGNSDAVWQAAGDLEERGLPVDAAWGFVDLAVTTYCPEHHMLVLTTTAAMGD
ncbi:DUF732 domain-containing protein [Geodermatophilus ruber]|uniref:DUF732 domain-containing protein n=1 Tax=Geodermatophilus ruber TaxID=504800 RepID=A0A1I4KQY7_9ACTN|nr:DUF732 domain-containing protein [Geodermatophilus ruber]SFL81150.1 Protein of unknown function [Geodermatophilus ruber]